MDLKSKLSLKLPSSVRRRAPSFKHTPLASAQNIRLLKLEPGSASAPISCTLSEAQWSQNPQYEALSYAWGSLALKRAVSCNGESLRVTDSLYEALKALRGRAEPRILWIDQVCINQADLDERSAQVLIMGRVFESATNVVIWLGPADKHSRAAISYLARLEESKASKAVAEKIEAEFAGEFAAARTSLGAFAGRAWFRRAWVVQEIAFACKIEVRCGDALLTWETLMLLGHVVAVIFSNSVNFAHLQVEMMVSFIQGARLARKYALTGAMSHLISLASFLEASDPRDKIYSQLSLGGLRIRPDYSLPYETVYTQAAVDFIGSLASRRPNDHKDSKKSNLMILLSMAAPFGKDRKMPSWVPDWSISAQLWPIGCPLEEKCLSAGGRTLGKLRIENGSSLKLDGAIYDTISFVGKEWFDLKKTHKPRDVHIQAKKWFEESEELLLHLPVVYPTDELRSEAYQRMVLLGHAKYKCKPTLSEVEDSFQPLRGLTLAPAASDKFYDEHRIHSWPGPRIRVLQGRVFFITERGWMGVAPYGAAQGHRICILKGGPTPYILENTSLGYKLVGDCYIEGIMRGEALRTPGMRMEDITII